MDLRAREERRVHFEGRILGGRADEHDRARLDVREKRVLLRLVEAVDFVDEQDGAPAALPRRVRSAAAMTSRISLIPDVTALKATNSAPVTRRQQPRERRLAGAWRAPEDQRVQCAAFDGLRAAGARPTSPTGRRTRRASAAASARPAACRAGARGHRRRESSCASWSIDQRRTLAPGLVQDERGGDGDVERVRRRRASECRFVCRRRPRSSAGSPAPSLPSRTQRRIRSGRSLDRRSRAGTVATMRRPRRARRRSLLDACPRRPAGGTCCPWRRAAPSSRRGARSGRARALRSRRAASAARITAPTLPGSCTSTSATASAGAGANAASSGGGGPVGERDEAARVAHGARGVEHRRRRVIDRGAGRRGGLDDSAVLFRRPAQEVG